MPQLENNAFGDISLNIPEVSSPVNLTRLTIPATPRITPQLDPTIETLHIEEPLPIISIGLPSPGTLPAYFDFYNNYRYIGTADRLMMRIIIEHPEYLNDENLQTHMRGFHNLQTGMISDYNIALIYFYTEKIGIRIDPIIKRHILTTFVTPSNLPDEIINMLFHWRTETQIVNRVTRGQTYYITK